MTDWEDLPIIKTYYRVTSDPLGVRIFNADGGELTYWTVHIQPGGEVSQVTLSAPGGTVGIGRDKKLRPPIKESPLTKGSKGYKDMIEIAREAYTKGYVSVKGWDHGEPTRPQESGPTEKRGRVTVGQKEESLLAGQRMNDASFRQDQMARRYEPHVKPLNDLVDRINLGRDRTAHAPYVPPFCGGIHARLLSLLSNPGPRTNPLAKVPGSGFACVENVDPTAARLRQFYLEAEISVESTVCWNVVPSYIHDSRKGLSRQQWLKYLEEGRGPLYEVVNLLPKGIVVMLHGDDAVEGWTLLIRDFPNLERERGLAGRVIATRHTSTQALIQHGVPREQSKGAVDAVLRADFAKAKVLLESPPSPPTSG